MLAELSSPICCRLTVLIAMLLALLPLHARADSESDARTKARVAALMAQMTLDEKLGQLNLVSAADPMEGQLGDVRSGRTGAAYPVAWKVRIDELVVRIEPLMDDQELDARASTGTVYWEGAVVAQVEGREIGRGYLEMTGYWRAFRA